MKLLTVKEVAQMLSFSKTKVYGMAGKELRCYKIGGAIRFSEAQVMEYLSSCEIEQEPSPRRVRVPALRHLKV